MEEQKKRVLIVEDDSIVRIDLNDLLTGLGYVGGLRSG